MKVVIALDTEDILSETAPDAQLWWAEELHKRGIKATFQLVGEMARKLERLGRYDVIDAIKKHDIGYHTNFHSIHPTHPEGIEGMSLEDSVNWIIKREEGGIKDIERLFGATPFSYTTPGLSWTPATLIANHHFGIKVSFVSPYAPRYQPYWYCGQLIMDYGEKGNFEQAFPVDYKVEDFFTQLGRLKEKTKDIDATVAIYTHPGRIFTAQHWDIPYKHGNNPSIEDAPPPPLWPAGHSEVIKSRVLKIMDGLLADPDIEITDVQSVYQDHQNNKFDLEQIKEEAPNGEYIPLKKRAESHDLFNEAIGDFDYSRWVPHTKDFHPENVFEHIEGLAWTTKI